MQKKIAGLSEQSLDRFVSRAKQAVGVRGAVNLLVTNNATVRSLNSRFRGQNKATDVLSFPAAVLSKQEPKRSVLAGEVAICGEIAAQNAMRFGHSPAEEVKILALHGILHLAGYDHERDDGEMARKEADLRRAFRLPAALTERHRQPVKTQIPIPQNGAARLRRARRTA